MAHYVSIQSGNWNDYATWDVPDTEWPEFAGDTVEITAGHTVTYNVSSAAEMGAISVRGLLSFATNMSTKLTMGHNDITVNNGGELRIGTAAAPLDKAYIAEILWNTTSDNAKGLSVLAGGKVVVYGDPAYYGSDDDTKLFANWTSGTSFQVVGDFSTKWQSGQELYIHKNAIYSSYLTDTARVTINGAPVWDGTKTTITISEAFPTGTFNAEGLVVNASRNIKFGKVGAVVTVGTANTNRPYFRDFSTSGLSDSQYSDIMLTGMYGMRVSRCHIISNCVVRNSYYCVGDAFWATYTNCTLISGVLYGIANCQSITFSGKVIACSSAAIQSPVNCDMTAEVVGNIRGVYGSIGGAFNVTLNGNGRGLQLMRGSTVAGYVYNNSFSFAQGSVVVCDNLVIGYDADLTSRPNTTDFEISGDERIFLLSPKMPATGTFSFTNRNTQVAQYPLKIGIENFGLVMGANYTFLGLGDLLKNSSTVRVGGATSSMEVIPLSYCNSTGHISIGNWIEHDVPASAQTRTIYIKGEGWTSFPTNVQLYLEAEYYDHATNLTRTTAVSTAVLADNTTWTAFTVSFTPAAVGRVDYRVYLKVYEAASKVYIDNALYNGTKMAEAQWSLGESQLMIDQDAWTASGGGMRIINGGPINV